MSDASIETKEILVSVQANGIIRRADTGYLIARFSDGVAYDSLVVYDPKPCAELEADNRRLREALGNISRQHLESEVPEDERDGGDYRGAYDCMIRVARAALASTEPEVCRWRPYRGGWGTGCGEATDKRNNSHRYCGYCGKPLVVVNEEDSDG